MAMVATVGAVAIFLSAMTPYPASEDARRLAAELLVMRGDAARLAEGKGLDDRSREALAARLQGAAGVLPILLRKGGGARHDEAVAALRRALAQADWRGAVAILSDLVERYRLDTAGILPAPENAAAIGFGRTLHENYCAACHDGEGQADWLPLPDLPRLARELQETEFVARLMTGVRGDASTALALPLSAGDIAALIAYYRNAGKAAR